MWTARTRLPEIFDLIRTPGILVVNEPTPKQATVYRDGRLSVTKKGHALIFEADLFAPDPRRFAATETALPATIPGGSSSKTESATNAGTTATHPVVTITGPAVNPRIADMTTGDELDIQKTLQGTDTLVIDLYEEAVTLNGAPADNLVSGGEWWSLPPGTRSLRYRVTQTSAGSSTATFRFRSAWS
jgi:hypothetical protein